MSSVLGRIRGSLVASIGDIAFGMEDGAVSIAGLVFGVAASTNDSHVVVLAGATGAAAGAVSMMAGTYLDVQSVRDRGHALLAAAEARVRADPDGQRAEIVGQLRSAGFTADEAAVVSGALGRNPGAMREYVADVQLGLGRGTQESPWAHAAWMLAADLIAAATPVAPFFFFDIATARLVSLVITGFLLAILGVGRGRIAHRNVVGTVLQTLAIAALAAGAGVLIGRLVSG